MNTARVGCPHHIYEHVLYIPDSMSNPACPTHVRCIRKQLHKAAQSQLF